MTFQGLLSLLPLLALSVPADDPVVRWEFGAEEETPLLAHGGVHRDVPGPRPPQYPDFEATNTAVKFDGKGAHFSFADRGANSDFDFTSGDAITIEAWVKVDDLRDGVNLYIIGKGRTGSAGFASDNQNWALRVRGINGKACVSFLFATPRTADGRPDGHWHRWTTFDGFAPKSGWHHIAATYRFGDPHSARGWIDGKAMKGDWDMGGPTKEKPIVDDDEIWIGSSQGGAAGNSFRGSLDQVAVHRVVLDDKTLEARYRRVGDPDVVQTVPERMPELGRLPQGRLIATFHEGVAAQDRWLQDDEIWPSEVARWEGTAFLLPRLPLRFDSWGIRDSWKPPVLVRLAADVSLPPGRHTFLVRARGLSRLWINGKVVARTEALRGSPNGEEPITPVPAPPLPGLRPASHRLHEVVVDADITGDGDCRVVLEAMAGGTAFRAEPGELCVAVRTPDGDSYNILQTSHSGTVPMPLTDDAVNTALVKIESSLVELDDRTRRAAAASRDAFWKRRHSFARQWAEQHPPPSVPANKAGASHPIDAFLADKTDMAMAAAGNAPEADAQHFYTKVLPILRSECFRCHGERDKGGLRLNSRAAALKGGDSATPAVVAGDVAASQLIARIRDESDDARMPPTGKRVSADRIAILEKWIESGAAWPAVPVTAEETNFAAITSDAAFLRRVYLDAVGVPPTESEARGFLGDADPEKRVKLIERLLNDERWADHWMGYWQDLLAENPTLINASLNSTGPFRWFLYDALRDGKPLDRLVTELILLRGNPHDGGSAGFGLAAQNDAPYAAKGHIVASAFLGIELQCARCHDSPYHSTKQRDLYALAAMFERKAVTVPKTSSVPPAFFEKGSRTPLIRVTLKPGEAVPPVWPFADVTGEVNEASLAALLENPHDTREQLAAQITGPQNERFSQVVVNRIWRRLMGAGIVEPAHDWEGRSPSHPQLLKWLANQFVASGYNIKHITRLILTSNVYQREAIGRNLTAEPELRFFNAPDRRRLLAEQVVDSFFAAAGQRMDVEPLTLDPDGRRPSSNRQNFGHVSRSWMLVSVSNERDRPSLTLPRIAVVTGVLEAFGWSAERQYPRTDRAEEANVLQPGVLSNSPLTVWLTRASQGSPLANLAVEATSPQELVDAVFLRFLTRMPSDQERRMFAAALRRGFADRLVPLAEIQSPPSLERLPQVTWSNHLRSEATTIQQEWERRSRIGPPPDGRLRSQWRELYEDFVWSVVNTREFVWMP